MTRSDIYWSVLQALIAGYLLRLAFNSVFHAIQEWRFERKYGKSRRELIRDILEDIQDSDSDGEAEAE